MLPAMGYVWEEGKNPNLFTEAAGFAPMEGVQCCMPPAPLGDVGFSSSAGSPGVTTMPVLWALVPSCGI